MRFFGKRTQWNLLRNFYLEIEHPPKWKILKKENEKKKSFDKTILLSIIDRISKTGEQVKDKKRGKKKKENNIFYIFFEFLEVLRKKEV